MKTIDAPDSDGAFTRSIFSPEPVGHHSLDTDSLQIRASRPHSAQPRAFLRWAGSKRYLLPHLIRYLPRTYGTYFEPFLGSGSLFFLLQPSSAVLADTCGPLVETFEAVRDDVSAVLRLMAPLQPKEKIYYQVRSAMPRGRFKRAANFIYLNYSCWNGLYRVNSAGQFNVPFGLPKTKNLADPKNLKACATLLKQRQVRLRTADFEESVEGARAGDLVYLDPPYVTKHNQNGFRDYNEKIFHWFDQERLARLAARLVRLNVHVLVSNASHPEIERLYPDFSAILVDRKSTLASNKKFRGRAKEVLFVPRSIAIR